MSDWPLKLEILKREASLLAFPPGAAEYAMWKVHVFHEISECFPNGAGSSPSHPGFGSPELQDIDDAFWQGETRVGLPGGPPATPDRALGKSKAIEKLDGFRPPR